MVFFEFLGWLYGDGVKEFFTAWQNTHWFFYHFFSVPEMTRTLFQPLKRLRESYGKGFDPQKFFDTFAINIIMRIFGFFVRLFFIAIGAVFQILVFAVGALSFFLYLAIPALVLFGIFWGLTLLILG